MSGGTRYLSAALLVVAALALPPDSQTVSATATEAGETSSACSLAPTGGTISEEVGGDSSKKYWLRVPAGLPGPEAPLVLSLHGWLIPATWHEDATGLSDLADAEKFIVAYPEADDLAWDVGGQDVDFLLDVVAEIADTWCVDPHRVHVDGVSLGGAMSQRMACEESDVFASVSSHIADDVTHPNGAPCTPDRPISVFLTCGEFAPCDQADPRVAWADRLNCPPPTQSSDTWGVVLHHEGCDAGTAVYYRSVAGQGHGYSGPVVDVVAAEMWDFFSAHPRP